MSYFAVFFIDLDQREERISDVPPFQWSKILKKKFIPLGALYPSSMNTDSWDKNHNAFLGPSNWQQSDVHINPNAGPGGWNAHFELLSILRTVKKN